MMEFLIFVAVAFGLVQALAVNRGRDPVRPPLLDDERDFAHCAFHAGYCDRAGPVFEDLAR